MSGRTKVENIKSETAATIRMADDHPHQSVADLRSQVLVAAAQGDVQAVSALLLNCGSHIQDEILTRNKYEGSVLKTAVEHHQMDIVRLLVRGFHVNINVTTLYVCAGAKSALFYAISKNNKKMVKELVELGANVNVLIDDLTPLIAACQRQSISIVRLLIELGANVNLREDLGYSPLMVLSTKNEPLAQSILDLLLDNGADCNLQDDFGVTALHLAAAYGNNAVVQKLLRKRARIIADNFGFAPPFRAAEWCVEERTLEVFLNSDALSREEKINALEFRAASLAPDDMNGVYELMHQALKARYEDPSNILWKPICEPVAAFGYVTESQTLEELETRKNDHHALLMECLTVQDRLLGGGAGKMCMIQNFCNIWEKLFNKEQYEQAMALAEHGIGATPSDGTVSIFNTLLQLQRINVQNPEMSILLVVGRGLQCCIKLLQGCPFDIETHMLCLKLLNRCIKLDLTAEKETALIHAKKFLASFPLQSPRFCSALHAATYLMMGYEDDIDLSLYKSVVDILVKCGAEINERDEEGHTILACVHCDMTPGDERREIVEFLLEQGANPAYIRKNYELPNEYIKDADIVGLLRQHYPLPLSHLAAFAIVDNDVQYEGLVPNILAEFIREHK